MKPSDREARREETRRFLEKDAALREAIRKAKGFESWRVGVCLSSFAAMLMSYWDGTWHVLVWSAFATLVIWTAIGIVVYQAWTKPELERIESMKGPGDAGP